MEGKNPRAVSRLWCTDRRPRERRKEMFSAESVPKLTQVSSPTSVLIRAIAFPTRSSSRLLCIESPEVTMENSLAPCCLASRAAATISSSPMRGYFSIEALDRMDCEQKAQSSEQRPDL